MIEKVPFLVGASSIKSELSIEKVGNLISERIFGGLEFGGKEKNIYEEVPAIFIKPHILGMRIILSGYSGLNENEGFVLSILPAKTFKEYKQEKCNLDHHLILILKDALKDVKEIQIKDL